MRKFPIALTALFMFGGAAHAQCTPEGMARFNANGAQLDAVAARIKAGDCSLIPEWKIIRGPPRNTTPQSIANHALHLPR
jgi:hypothetical protein